MFDPWTATLDEAKAALYGRWNLVRTTPLMQWHAATVVKTAKEAVERGDSYSLLMCVRHCLDHGLVAPDWLARKFDQQHDKVVTCEVGSWDRALGKPYPRRHLTDMRRRRRLRDVVLYAVVKERFAPDGSVRNDAPPIDEALFTRIGAALNISKTLCAKIYYEALKTYPPDRP